MIIEPGTLIYMTIWEEIFLYLLSKEEEIWHDGSTRWKLHLFLDLNGKKREISTLLSLKSLVENGYAKIIGRGHHD